MTAGTSVSQSVQQTTQVRTLDVYARAGESGDVDLVLSAYGQQGALLSPIGGRLAFRGEGDLRVLMTAVYRVTKDSRFTRRSVDGNVGLLTASSRVWGVRLEEAFVVDFDDDGLIKRVTVHMRPLPALMVFAVVVGARMAAHPGVMWRAWRGPAE